MRPKPAQTSHLRLIDGSAAATNRRRCNDECGPPSLGLRCAVADLPAHLDGVLGDENPPADRVDVLDAEAGGFAAAKTASCWDPRSFRTLQVQPRRVAPRDRHQLVGGSKRVQDSEPLPNIDDIRRYLL